MSMQRSLSVTVIFAASICVIQDYFRTISQSMLDSYDFELSEIAAQNLNNKRIFCNLHPLD